MEKESYQPSTEEMEKAQEIADAVQNERADERMTWEEERKSDLRELYIDKERGSYPSSTEEMEKAQEIADAVQNERADERMTGTEKGATIRREGVSEQEEYLGKKGLGEFSNIKLKEYEGTTSVYGSGAAVFEGDVDGHRIIINVKKNSGEARPDMSEAIIDGVALSSDDRKLLRKKVIDFLESQMREYEYADAARKDSKRIYERQNDKEAREKERREVEMRKEWIKREEIRKKESGRETNDILKNILSKEKGEKT